MKKNIKKIVTAVAAAAMIMQCAPVYALQVEEMLVLGGDDNKTKAETELKEESSETEEKIVCSAWAEGEVKKALEIGIVPDEIKDDYTKKITRGEFCKLAVNTYVKKTGNEIEKDIESPFSDVNDVYISNASKLNIVSGIGDGLFAPDKEITRQEAAVMLVNLANAAGIETGKAEESEKFADEDNFAAWANEKIYTIASTKTADGGFVMKGTGGGKFSPLDNYTREQAAATMVRLYGND
ncbi:MAG: S-layer homology domain-containing protein [Firmicutes bacterium]|nr:S-layer homology domain-containing protein [Bacillota bacterium]